MKDKSTNPPTLKTGDEQKTNLPGYPIYPPSEDIYNRSQKLGIVDKPDIFGPKTPVEDEKMGAGIEERLKEDGLSSLDIPGADLDDQQETVGSEDEENNFYSLGGESHHDLEEDRSI